MTAVVIRGDAAHLPLPDGSVDLVVTSPPYFGLRSYADGGEQYDGQIGSEATPGEYLEALWACTAEWVRVLKPGGSIFVNMGDVYNSGPSGRRVSSGLDGTAQAGRGSGAGLGVKAATLPAKCLLGLPRRYAIGCVDRLGLILRAEIIWDKPNGLPESVTDRVRRSHEQVFHFTRLPRYYAAVDEIREPQKFTGGGAHRNPALLRQQEAAQGRRQFSRDGHDVPLDYNPLGKLPGSVWPIPSAPLVVPEHLGIDHFAAYPPELVRRIVLGWSPPGVCTACGEGRRPVTDKRIVAHRRNLKADNRTARNLDNHFDWSGYEAVVGHTEATITGYACACPDTTAPARPAVVVDPFGGTGTTALVASAYGRVGVTVDRSADYCRLARWRVADPGERARALHVPKPPPVPDGQGSLFDEVPA